MRESKTAIVLAIPTLFGVAAWGQEGTPVSQGEPASQGTQAGQGEQAAQGASTGGAQATQTPDEKLQAIVARYQAQQQEVYEAYEKATSDEERSKILEGLPGPEFAPEFRALAEEVKGTDAAAHAWIWVLRLIQESDKPEALRVLDTLLAEYLSSPALDELASDLRYAEYYYGAEPVEGALRKIAEGSPHRSVQAAALFTLGAIFTESSDESKKPQGRELLERVAQDYADVDYWGRSTYGKEAGGYLFELDHLQIGMVAPDFETVDEGGTPWKLSDYRGKVVVVDFWGFW